MTKLPEIDRKTLKQPDEFVRGGRSVLDFLVKQKKRFVPVLIGAAVVFTGLVVFDWWSARKDKAAWESYSTAAKAPEAERWDKLKAVYSEHGKSRAVFFAAIDLADHYYELAKKAVTATPPVTNPPDATTAGEWYGKSLEFSGLLPKERQLILINKGNAAELAGKLDEALADYKQAEDLASDAKPLAQLSSARIHELKNEPDKAVELYEKVSVESQATEFGKLAKNSVRRLKSPLLTKEKP